MIELTESIKLWIYWEHKMADKFYKEKKAEQKREDKEMITLRNGVFELKRELRKHEKEPMNKAHPMKK